MFHVFISFFDGVVVLYSLFSYRDQFSMLAENMARERHDLQTREKAQDKVRVYWLYINRFLLKPVYMKVGNSGYVGEITRLP